MNDTALTLNAIINYIGEHIKLSNESWSFKGIDSDGFNARELLELIYYVNPELFAGLKAHLKAKSAEITNAKAEKMNIPTEEEQ